MAEPIQFFGNVLLREGITENIFRHFIGGWATLPPPKDDPRTFLSLVCKRWKKLVRCTPDFWDQIIFLPIPFTNDNVQLSIFRRYMRRSKPNTLSFFFSEVDPSGDSTWTPTNIGDQIYGRCRFSIVTKIILPHVRRIKSLTCLIGKEDNITFLLNIRQGQFRALETVNITFINDLETHEFAFTSLQLSEFKVFRSLPRLHDASFQVLNGIRPTDLQLPWNQITRLQFGVPPMSLESFIEIMRHSAPSLHTASFEVEFDKQSSFTSLPTTQINMSHLQKLHVFLQNPSFYPRFWDLFHLPALRYFWVEKDDIRDGNRWNVPQYTELLAPSTASLRHLLLCDFDPSGPEQLSESVDPDSPPPRRKTSYQELEGLFSVAENIEILHLPLGVHIHSSTIDKLGSGELLPHLRALELSSVNVVQVLSMVDERNRLASSSTRLPPSSISSLCVTVPRGNALEETYLQKRAHGLGSGCHGDLKFTDASLSSFGI